MEVQVVVEHVEQVLIVQEEQEVVQVVRVDIRVAQEQQLRISVI